MVILSGGGVRGGVDVEWNPPWESCPWNFGFQRGRAMALDRLRAHSLKRILEVATEDTRSSPIPGVGWESGITQGGSVAFVATRTAASFDVGRSLSSARS